MHQVLARTNESWWPPSHSGPFIPTSTKKAASMPGLIHAPCPGAGASGEGNTKGWGNRPFLDLLDVESGDKQRLWQSSPPRYEFSGALIVDTNSDEPIRWLLAVQVHADAHWQVDSHARGYPQRRAHQVADGCADGFT